MKILVVDDEIEIADLVELYLINDGYEVIKCHTGKEVLEAIESMGHEIRLALLDIMLPDIDGFSICRKIREKYVFPIMMLTARTEDLDKISGLSFGADDYITKPFNPLVVIAKVKAQLRRFTSYNSEIVNDNPPYEENVFEYDGLVINKNTHQCFLFDKEILLTPIEFKILFTLFENRGNVVSAETLFETVWEEKFLQCNNTVMVHIRRIREKLQEPPRNPRYIKTVWGVGYKIETGKN